MTTAVGQDLAEIKRAAFGTDGPQYVGQILRAERARLRQVLEVGVNADSTLLALDVHLAAGFGGKTGAPEIESGRRATVSIVDRLDSAANNGNSVNGHVVGFLIINCG